MKKLFCITISLLLALAPLSVFAANVNTLGSYYGPNPIYIGDFGLGMIMGEDPSIFEDIPDYTVGELIDSKLELYKDGYAFHLGGGFYLSFGYFPSYDYFLPVIIDSTTPNLTYYPVSINNSTNFRITDFSSYDRDSVVSFDSEFRLYDYVDRHNISGVDFTRDLFFTAPILKVDGVKKSPIGTTPHKLRIGARPGTTNCSLGFASDFYYGSNTTFDSYDAVNFLSNRFISNRCTYTDLTYIRNIPNYGIPYFNLGLETKTVTIPNSALRAMTTTNYSDYANFAAQYGYEIVDNSLYIIPNFFKDGTNYKLRLCFYNSLTNTLYKGDREKYIQNSVDTLDSLYPESGSTTITYTPSVENRYNIIKISGFDTLGDYSSFSNIGSSVFYGALVPPFDTGICTYYDRNGFAALSGGHSGPTCSDNVSYCACFVCDFIGTYDTSIFIPFTEGVSVEYPDFDYDRFDPYSPDPMNPVTPPGPVNPDNPGDDDYDPYHIVTPNNPYDTGSPFQLFLGSDYGGNGFGIGEDNFVSAPSDETVLEQISMIVTTTISWIGDFIVLLSSNIILFIPLVIKLVGLGISLSKRLMSIQ